MTNKGNAQAGRSDARPSVADTDIVTVQHSPNVLLKCHVVDRVPGFDGASAVEGVIEVNWKIPRGVREVWRHFKDFNSWQNRYGYYYDGVMGDEEGYIVHMSDRTNNYGLNIPYLVRKAVPEQLLYLESQPYPFIDKSGTWSGHNVMTLQERDGETFITIFMEHTWQSQTRTVEDLRHIVQGAVDAAVKFWREFFIPDLEALVLKGGQ
jgi:hypothetical protein